MHNRDSVESCAEALDGLGGERDFGEHHDCGFAFFDCFLDCFYVKLGFAAVGDAEEERDAEFIFVDSADNVCEGFYK